MWNFAEYKDSLALYEDSQHTLSYAELLECAAILKPHLEQKTLCAILCRNTIGAVASYVGIYLNGSVPLLLNAELEAELLNHLLNLYRPALLCVPASLRAQFPKCREILQLHSYSILKSPYAQNYHLHQDLALLLSSSGSTGSPKFVRQSYQNVESNTESICSFLKLNEKQRPITTLPMYYTYGLSVINTHLNVGATIVLTDHSLMQKAFWILLEEQQATSISGVPYTYEMLNHLRFVKMNLPHLTTLTQAGGHLSTQLQQIFASYCQDQHKQFFIMYGQAEATARISYLPPERALDKPGSIGIAIPGGKLSLEDEDGQVITEAGKTGELIYRGQNVTLGYATKPEDLSLGDHNLGVLHTQDLGYFDEDGYFYITGRKSRVIKIFGNRVSLEEIDELLHKEYPTLEFATLGQDDLIRIFVTEQVESALISSYLSTKTRLNAVAFKVVYLKQLPRNDSGKVLYGKLQELCS